MIMAKNKLRIPRPLKGRLSDVASAHKLGSAADAAMHFVTRGLDHYKAPAGNLGQRLEHAVDEQGYSSVDELIEHLLLRGLRAYEEPADSPEALAARLRGLGYID
jgi:hypothetical protein